MYIVILILLCSSIFARDIYIAKDGSGDYSSIQAGVNAASAGDTVIVKPGNYGSEHVSISKSGTSNNYITIKAENPETEIIEMDGFSLNDVHFITLEGFEISGRSIGISVDEGGDNILRRLILRSNSADGIEVWKSHNNLIEECQFLDPTPPSGGESVQDYGINFYHSDNNKVLNSYFFGHHNQALSFKKNCHGGLVSGNTFEGCFYTCIYLGQNDEETGEADLWCSDLMVENNVFRPGAGSYVLKNAVHVRNVKGAIVRNNFMEGMNKDSGHAVWLWDNQNGEDAHIYNNVVINSDKPAFRLERSSTVYTHHNTLINTAGVTVNSLQGENNYMNNNYNVNSNPDKFVGPFTSPSFPSSPNPQFTPDFSRAQAYRLQSDSPLVDTGNTVSEVTADFDGISRPQGPKYDIGAYEYTGSAPPTCTGYCCPLGYSCSSPISGTCSSGQCCVSQSACTHTPNCGDGTCDPGETCSSCSADCPTGSEQVCCSGTIYTGNCCSDNECNSGYYCSNSHECALQTQTCSQLGGVDCCTGGETCSGTSYPGSSDCSGICCSQACTQGGSGVSVDSTYPGYNIDVIDDEIIDPYGGTSTTWASGESSTEPHWVVINFAQPTSISNVDIYWTFNDYRQAFMSSQEVQVQYWDGSNYVTASTITNSGETQSSTATFSQVTTIGLRFYQPSSMGPVGYSNILWLTEIDYSVGGSACGDADGDDDGVVSINELINYIEEWKIRNVSIGELIDAIEKWKIGC